MILIRHVVRAYWAHAFGEAPASPPDCSALDNTRGVGIPGGICEVCPYSQWASGKENAQACRQITRLMLLQPGDLLPIFLPLPPSAYKICQAYALNVRQRHVLHGVLTRIGLSEKKSGQGITYSIPRFTAGGPLAPEVIKDMEAYRQVLLPLVTAAPVTFEEDESGDN